MNPLSDYCNSQFQIVRTQQNGYRERWTVVIILTVILTAPLRGAQKCKNSINRSTWSAPATGLLANLRLVCQIRFRYRVCSISWRPRDNYRPGGFFFGRPSSRRRPFWWTTEYHYFVITSDEVCLICVYFYAWEELTYLIPLTVSLLHL